MAVMLPCRKGCSDQVIQAVEQVVRAGGVVAIPTESYYGLGVDPTDAVAVGRVCRIKARPDGKPILVLIGDESQLAPLIEEAPPAARVLMEAFWPGPLTLIFPAAVTLPESLTAGGGSVGIRLTADPFLGPLLHRIGPLTGTSANPSGGMPVRTAAEVAATLGHQVDLILDGDTTAGGAPSTVVDTRKPVTLVREGRILREQIVATLNRAGFRLQG